MKTYLKDLKLNEVIKRLKNGEVIKDERSDDTIKYYDGMICRLFKNGTYLISTTIPSDPDFPYYFEEDHFEIKETGFYKTRDGSKVYISWIKYYNDNGMCASSDEFVCYGIFENGDNVFTWNVFGKSNLNSDKLDIISKWED